MGKPLSFIIGINTLKWLKDTRYNAMMEKLPFDIGILVEIMLAEWTTIKFCDPRTGYEAIIDELYTYDLEDLNISAAGMIAIGDYLAPYCDLIVEIIYDFYEQTSGQLEPIFNNAEYRTCYLKFDGFHGPGAFIANLINTSSGEVTGAILESFMRAAIQMHGASQGALPEGAL